MLLSINPRHAKNIFSGIKTVELRKVCPRRIFDGDTVLVYVSSPVKALVGGFEVDSIVEAAPEDLWELIKGKAAIERILFDQYFSTAAIGYGVFIKNTWSLKDPIVLRSLRVILPGFVAPQGYKYLSKNEYGLLRKAWLGC